MNRVIIVNLNGNAYQLEESGHDALRVYLDNAARRLEGNPDKDEIIADIEQAIADKFRAVLGPNKTVVITREVECILAEMGPVQDGSASNDEPTHNNSRQREADGSQSDNASKATDRESGRPESSARRLYAIKEGAMLAGVCNGLAAYFNVDVTIIRILFVILTLLWGAGILLYFVMALIIPTATTSAEKAAAFGAASTAQEFIRRAKAGYYEGMKAFQDKDSRREWKRKFKHQMRGWKQGFEHEMNRNDYWRRHHWAPPAHAGFGNASSQPFFHLIRALIVIGSVAAVYSLVTTHAILGIPLPVSVPLWIGIVAIVVIGKLLCWPFKMVELGSYYRGGQGPMCTGPFGTIGDFVIGIGFLLLVIWIADRYIPGFHEGLKDLPPLLHQAIDSVQNWLERH